MSKKMMKKNVQKNFVCLLVAALALVSLLLSAAIRPPLSSMTSLFQSCGAKDGVLEVGCLGHGSKVAVAWTLGSVDAICRACMQMVVEVHDKQKSDPKLVESKPGSHSNSDADLDAPSS